MCTNQREEMIEPYLESFAQVFLDDLLGLSYCWRKFPSIYEAIDACIMKSYRKILCSALICQDILEDPDAHDWKLPKLPPNMMEHLLKDINCHGTARMTNYVSDAIEKTLNSTGYLRLLRLDDTDGRLKNGIDPHLCNYKVILQHRVKHLRFTVKNLSSLPKVKRGHQSSTEAQQQDTNRPLENNSDTLTSGVTGSASTTNESTTRDEAGDEATDKVTDRPVKKHDEADEATDKVTDRPVKKHEELCQSLVTYMVMVIMEVIHPSDPKIQPAIIKLKEMLMAELADCDKVKMPWPHKVKKIVKAVKKDLFKAVKNDLIKEAELTELVQYLMMAQNESIYKFIAKSLKNRLVPQRCSFGKFFGCTANEVTKEVTDHPVEKRDEVCQFMVTFIFMEILHTVYPSGPKLQPGFTKLKEMLMAELADCDNVTMPPYQKARKITMAVKNDVIKKAGNIEQARHLMMAQNESIYKFIAESLKDRLVPQRSRFGKFFRSVFARKSTKSATSDEADEATDKVTDLQVEKHDELCQNVASNTVKEIMQVWPSDPQIQPAIIQLKEMLMAELADCDNVTMPRYEEARKIVKAVKNDLIKKAGNIETVQIDLMEGVQHPMMAQHKSFYRLIAKSLKNHLVPQRGSSGGFFRSVFRCRARKSTVCVTGN